MQIELDRATFRRLVLLHLSLLPLFLALGAAEFVLEPWPAFTADFDALVTSHFGPSRLEALPLWLLALGFVLVIGWLIASTIGLLWFKRWARFGFWASSVVAFGAMLFVDGFRPSAYSTTVYDFVAVIDSGLAGAIFMLCYAKGFGSNWFEPAVQIGN